MIGQRHDGVRVDRPRRERRRRPLAGLEVLRRPRTACMNEYRSNYFEE